MLLNLSDPEHNSNFFGKFTKNGIIIDTSVLKIIVDGIVETKISKKEDEQFSYVTALLDLIKANNRWDKFLITPHVLTETCNHLNRDHNHRGDDMANILREIFPLIADMVEKNVRKNDLLDFVDLNRPVVEIPDISIHLVADQYSNKQIKIAILACDRVLRERYIDSKDVLVMDYRTNIGYLH